MKPPNVQPTLLPDEAVQKLSALMGRRRQLLEMLVMEKNHLLSTRLSLRSRGAGAHRLAASRKSISSPQQIQNDLQETPGFRDKDRILRWPKAWDPSPA